MPLDTAQRLLGQPGRVEHILVSNTGDAERGVTRSDEVIRLLEPTLTPLGLEADPEKEDLLAQADEEGAGFISLFTTFGSFSIVAGILLIFLIFVMLAAERRGELGIARAVGTRRSHLVQTYLFEGVAYDVVAAVVGILLGVAVAYGMVFAMAQALQAFDVELRFDVTAESLVLAYALGVLLTLIVVTVSAWRVSMLNIATAIRNLPEPPKQERRRRWLWPALGLVAGTLLAAAGAVGAVRVFHVGHLPCAAEPCSPSHACSECQSDRLYGFGARRSSLSCCSGGLRLHHRVLRGIWRLPRRRADDRRRRDVGDHVQRRPHPEAPELRRGTRARLAPVFKLSIAYPLRSLFRTGVTLAMFTLVVFTLVAGTTISGSFMKASNNLDVFAGGFDVRAVAPSASPIEDAAGALSRAGGGVEVTAEQSSVPLDARQAPRPFEAVPRQRTRRCVHQQHHVRVRRRRQGLCHAKDVWRELRARAGLAVVDQFAAPRRDNTRLKRRRISVCRASTRGWNLDPVPVEAIRARGKGRN